LTEKGTDHPEIEKIGIIIKTRFVIKIILTVEVTIMVKTT